MRCALWGAIGLLTVTATSSWGVEPDDAAGPRAGEPGWHGPLWDHDENTGALMPSVTIVSFPGEVDQWIEVRVLGMGVDYGWSEGPYEAQLTPFSVPIVLPAQANAKGLVAVLVRVSVTDPETGRLKAVEQTPAAYVINAGIAGETWYDAATAAQKIVRALPAGLALAEDEVLDDLVGLEVTP